MAKTFFETEPDKTQTIGAGRHTQYLFTYYEPGKGDQIGAYIVVVYSPMALTAAGTPSNTIGPM